MKRIIIFFLMLCGYLWHTTDMLLANVTTQNLTSVTSFKPQYASNSNYYRLTFPSNIDLFDDFIGINLWKCYVGNYMEIDFTSEFSWEIIDTDCTRTMGSENEFAPEIGLIAYETVFNVSTISPAPPINGVCGSAETTYDYSETSYSGDFCSSGDSVPEFPDFPGLGSSETWTCSGINGGDDDICVAYRSEAPSGTGSLTYTGSLNDRLNDVVEHGSDGMNRLLGGSVGTIIAFLIGFLILGIILMRLNQIFNWFK